MSNDKTDAASISHFELERGRFLISDDIDSLGAMIASDLVHIHANGKSEGKADYLRTMRETLHIVRISRPTFVVRIYGDVAISTGLLNQTIRVRASGVEISMAAACTQVWRRHGGTWLLTTFQATSVS